MYKIYLFVLLFVQFSSYVHTCRIMFKRAHLHVKVSTPLTRPVNLALWQLIIWINYFLYIPIPRKQTSSLFESITSMYFNSMKTKKAYSIIEFMSITIPCKQHAHLTINFYIFQFQQIKRPIWIYYFLCTNRFILINYLRNPTQCK